MQAAAKRQALKKKHRLGVVSWLGSGGRSLAHFVYFELDEDSIFVREKKPTMTLCGAGIGPVAMREHPHMTKHEPQPCPRCLSINPQG